MQHHIGFGHQPREHGIGGDDIAEVTHRPPPASAATPFSGGEALAAFSTSVSQDDVSEYSRDRRWRDNRYRGNGRRYYDEPVYRNTRVWRGRDGRTYCRSATTDGSFMLSRAL